MSLIGLLEEIEKFCAWFWILKDLDLGYFENLPALADRQDALDETGKDIGGGKVQNDRLGWCIVSRRGIGGGLGEAYRGHDRRDGQGDERHAAQGQPHFRREGLGRRKFGQLPHTCQDG